MAQGVDTSVARNGLSGFVVGIPAARKAEESATLVARYGGVPVVGPTVRENEVPDPAVAGATYKLLQRAPTWSVHLTGIGTRRWFRAAQRLGCLDQLLEQLRAARLVARGPKVRAAMHEYDLEPYWIPPDELSATIAGWLIPQLQPNDVVVVQCAGESPPGFITALTSNGSEVVEVAPYEWDLPADKGPAKELARAVANNVVDVLLVTSAPQVRHLLAIAKEAGCEEGLRDALAHHVFVAAVGEVAAAALRDEGLSVDVIAQPPRLGALVRAVAARRDDVMFKRSSSGGNS